MLVGHSYGGNVISTAATSNDQVKALVYLNGWMCDVGESQQELLERFEGSLVGPSIRPVPFTSADGSEGGGPLPRPGAFREAFAGDVDQATADVMAAAQRPYAATAFAGAPSAPPAWETLPCWYLLGTEDKAIPPALQRFMAERANATIVRCRPPQPAGTSSSFRPSTRPCPRRAPSGLTHAATSRLPHGTTSGSRRADDQSAEQESHPRRVGGEQADEKTEEHAEPRSRPCSGQRGSAGGQPTVTQH